MVSLSELGMFSIEFLWCHPLTLSLGTVAAKDRRRCGGRRAHTRESERRRRREGGNDGGRLVAAEVNQEVVSVVRS